MFGLVNGLHSIMGMKYHLHQKIGKFGHVVKSLVSNSTVSKKKSGIIIFKVGVAWL